MLQHAGEEEMAGSGGCTVMVGVKLDSQSRELLTWALVKVAQPGDSVIALHVLGNNEIVDREGRSSLLSLVKAFDSVLAVYEGFCNLKQVGNSNKSYPYITFSLRFCAPISFFFLD
uniref:Uncharacterized protein LOC105109411 n=1 Tax=Rhizophora mucronata TaxID=61149 RepID=A0A2P2L349_RHIMU